MKRFLLMAILALATVTGFAQVQMKHKATLENMTMTTFGRTEIPENGSVEFWHRDPEKAYHYGFSLDVWVDRAAVGKSAILVEQQGHDGAWNRFIEHDVNGVAIGIQEASVCMYSKAYRISLINKSKDPIGTAVVMSGMISYKEIPLKP